MRQRRHQSRPWPGFRRQMALPNNVTFGVGSDVSLATERLPRYVWVHRDDLFTFLLQPGLDATNWRAELAIRFGVILRQVWGGSRTWAGAQTQAVLLCVWRTCWTQARSALNFLSQLLRGQVMALALPP